ncbi:MAG: Fur family transcriptional regulator [Usitatibacteraceae bacterium]
MKPAYLDHLAAAESAIRATGERLTQPRVAVLACLLASDRASSHLDVAGMLADNHAVDRVTVYRVLEWLVNQGISHRIAGDDRVWRFMINPQESTAKSAASGPHGHHAHFTCETCGQTFCLDKSIPKVDVKLPKGFRPSEIDLVVRGRCAACA